MGGYIETILEPDERVMHRAKIHWMIYGSAIALLLLGVIFFWFTMRQASACYC